MIKINFKKKSKLDDEFASEVVEILEEKLDGMNVKLPSNMLDEKDKQIRFRSDLRKELIYEISDFISCNKGTISRKVA